MSKKAGRLIISRGLIIKISILMAIAAMSLTALFSIFKYSMVSIPPGVIKKIEFYTDKDLQEIIKTRKLKRNNETIFPAYPKIFVADIKKNYYCVQLNS